MRQAVVDASAGELIDKACRCVNAQVGTGEEMAGAMVFAALVVLAGGPGGSGADRRPEREAVLIRRWVDEILDAAERGVDVVLTLPEEG